MPFPHRFAVPVELAVLYICRLSISHTVFLGFVLFLLRVLVEIRQPTPQLYIVAPQLLCSLYSCGQ